MTALVHSRKAAPTEATPTAPRDRWPRLALAGLLAATAVLYLWNLSASGYGNTFYAAAAQAGSQSWSAWFFGSFDAQNFITVDKPAASLWVTGLSVRLFGMNSWAVLAPQALMGVATVAVLYATVRRAIPDRTLGAVAGLAAGAVLALTPAAALMFRFNNPDALLVMLMTIGAYCATRAVQAASWRWLALVGVALGFAFLTKMLQGLLVLPAFAVTYLLFANTGWLRRVAHLATAAVALVVSAGWWVLAVQLTPSTARPYVGGSTDNSVLNLALGYNGLGRIFGHRGGGPDPGGQHGPAPVPGGYGAPPGGPRGGFGPGNGAAGSAFGGPTGWHRLFGSEMGYEISWLLPVALFAIVFGSYLAARGRLSRGERAALVLWGGWLIVTAVVFSYMSGVVHPYYTVALAPAVAALTGLATVWAWRRRRDWDGRVAIAVMIALAAVWSLVLLHRAHFGPEWLHWLMTGVALAAALVLIAAGAVGWERAVTTAIAAGIVAGSAGTAAFAIATAATPHHGGIPAAVNTADAHAMGGPPGGGSGFDRQQDNAQLAELLAATNTTWSAATNGAQTASTLEIASGTSVMAIGGFSSGDPVPTLQQFVDYVHAGKIGYYVAAGDGHGRPPGPPRSSNAQQIADWVAHNYTATTVGETTVYRLS
ncbi:ArnT family glycosyltransferase [Mycobacterium sp.]|uniref:ArnT family glycosyltransferase n=1 Tax=Mycobacterium sp. TaxID=1785 RepID=UPI002D43AA69|nr:glycosyltransferase family 39 protein [Mycobacterium sp.]HZA12179.1 glycosyltransferase family 39 protein [Mycobacterium sp.]